MSTLSPLERWWLNTWFHRWRVRREIPRFLRSCPEPFRGEVLEVGAGSGWTSQRILETFPQVQLTATDSDAAATERFALLRTRYGDRLRVRQADLLELPFDRHAFDIVVAIHVLHHVADVRQAVRQALRVLRPGGLFGVQDEAAGRLIRVHHRSREELKAVLNEEGCDVLTASGTHRYTIWARKPYPVSPGNK